MTVLPEGPVGAQVSTRIERFGNRFFRLVTDEVLLPGGGDSTAAERPTGRATSQQLPGSCQSAETMEQRSPTVRRDYVADHLGAVGVVVYDTDADTVLLVRQYRHPVGRQLWELPAGLLDVPGESALVCAQRELAEEADLSARRWDVLLDLLVTPGSSDEAIRVYLARDVSPVPSEQRVIRVDEEATMVSQWLPLDQAVAAVLAGELENAACVAGILALQHTKNAGWPPLRTAEATWRARPNR